MGLSVLLTGIRPIKWQRLYKSIESAYSQSWELIIVSPYPLPPELNNKKNIIHLEDFGSPARCQQRALCMAHYDLITWCVDDGWYLPNSLDKAIKQLDNKQIVTLKYTEGDNYMSDMRIEDYYIIKYHLDAHNLYVPSEFKLLNFGIMPTDLIISLGGWDAQTFETLALAELDFAIRCQFNGIKIVVSEDVVLNCEWMPGLEGDHAPMHYAQIEHDMPIYKDIYSKPTCEDRVAISIHNWAYSPKKWERRFGSS